MNRSTRDSRGRRSDSSSSPENDSSSSSESSSSSSSSSRANSSSSPERGSGGESPRSRDSSRDRQPERQTPVRRDGRTPSGSSPPRRLRGSPRGHQRRRRRDQSPARGRQRSLSRSPSPHGSDSENRNSRDESRGSGRRSRSTSPAASIDGTDRRRGSGNHQRWQRRHRSPVTRRRRSQSRSPTPPRLTNRCSRDPRSRRQPRSRSRTPSSRTLAKLIGQFLKKGSEAKNNQSQIHHLIPEFDPKVKTTTADQWLARVDQICKAHGKGKTYKLTTAISKLRGDAKDWFALAGAITKWRDFEAKLKSHFPGEVQFGKAIEEASNYHSQAGQDLQSYCVKKVGLFEKTELRLTDKQLVQFVAHGIGDPVIKRSALTRGCRNITELTKYLSNFETHPEEKQSKNSETKNFKNEDRNRPQKRNNARDHGQQRDANDYSKRSRIECFTCKEYGHYSRDCLQNKDKDGAKTHTDRNKEDSMFCTFCRTSTHDTKDCRSKNRIKPKQNQ